MASCCILVPSVSNTSGSNKISDLISQLPVSQWLYLHQIGAQGAGWNVNAAEGIA